MSDGDAVAPGTPQTDACFHFPWPSEREIYDYMTADWRDYVGTPGSLPAGLGARPIHLRMPYRAASVQHGLSADDPLADADPRFGRIVAIQEPGIFVGGEPNAYLAVEIARAANDWFADRWLGPGDPRIHGTVVVASQFPDAAAAEIRRTGAHDRIVAVLLGTSGVGKPFGSFHYEPIFSAACDLELPVIIHADGDAVLDSGLNATGGGQTSTHSEFKVLAAHSSMSHLASLLTQGVFEKFPRLQVLLAGSGATWLPGFVWRFNNDFRALRREVPWVKRFPSECVHDHVKVAAYPLDTVADPAGMRRALGAYDGFDEILCFASGGRRDDHVTAGDAEACVPTQWRTKFFTSNAARLFAR